MILIFVMKEFDKELSEISTLIRTLESDFYEMERETGNLVQRLEDMAGKYSLPIQPKLALIRGNLICGYKEEGTMQSRKEKLTEKKRFLVQQLAEAAECIENYFMPARKQFDECEKICGQIIVHAYHKGLGGQGEDLLTQVLQDAELAAHLMNVKAVVGGVNTRIIFEQAQVYMK